MSTNGLATPLHVSTFSDGETLKTKPYHNGVAGPSRKVDVVRIGGDSTISLLYVACHILADALNALTGAVGPLNT